MSLLAELKRRKVFRVAAGYIVFAWVLIQVVETIFPAFGFDDAAFRMLVITLAIGFVPAVILSWAFELTRGGLVAERSAGEIGRIGRDVTPVGTGSAPPGKVVSVLAVLQRPLFSIPLTLAVLMAIGTIFLLSKQLLGSRTARLELLPQIENLVAEGDIDRAFELALEAETYLPGDPLLERLWSDVAVSMSFDSEPAGAEVFYKRYSDVDGEWELLGSTPISGVRLPRTVLRWRMERPGFEIAERAGEAFDGSYVLRLVDGKLPEDMVRVPSSQRFFLLTGYSLPPYDVPTFLASRLEVTNREYFEFIQSGAYENDEYWHGLSFERDGNEISWQSAVDEFRDRTGRFGPSTWEGGTFPEGSAQLPVTGISWYEAAAYAEFRGRQLPTIYHWSSMTLFPATEEIKTVTDSRPGFGQFRSELVALSNFSGKTVRTVGGQNGVAPFGTYDAAGNAREWCWNATGDGGERYILGASFSDPTYLYTYGVAKSPWDRSAVNGVRLVSYEPDVSVSASLRAPMPLPEKESLAPVSDEIFQIYRDFFDYDRTPLNARVEAPAVEDTHWTRETVSFDATYNDDRVLAHVFLPKNIDPPYQVIVYYPSSDAIFRRTSDDLELGFVDFIIKSGRAVVFPVLWGTYERNVGLDTTWPKDTREYSDHVMKWIQDFRRTVDYLETRHDMDLDSLGFYGFSWGGWNGPIVLALDERFETGAFLSGGIPPTLARPEASSASFASRVTQPVLMISGEHDVLRPVATYQAPLFESLGTPDRLKRHAILSGGHLPPKGEIVAEVLAWFDQYLGDVE